MRIKSDAAPPCAFIIEPNPSDPNGVLIHMYENAEFITPKPYWQYDDYTMAALRRSDLEADIETNSDAWLALAKASEETE